MTARWQDPQPPTPSKAVGLAIGIVAMLALTIMAVLYLTTDRAGATGGYPTTTGATTTAASTTTTTSTTIATTTTAATTTAPTTTVATTTTAAVGCAPLCGGVVQDTTTTAPATTVPATTTTAAPTTTVAPDTGALPSTGADAPVAGAVVGVGIGVTAADELPVTGGNPAWLAVLGACLLALGLLAVAWVRTP